MTTLSQSETIPSMPPDTGEPVFGEPWQAQAFALAVKLSDQGYFTWKEWAATLANELQTAASRGEPDDGSRYYSHWLAACYLYRAIDSTGATIDFLLSPLRDAEAAKRLFRKALSNPSHPQPRVINTDLAPIYGSAIPDIKKEGTLRSRCRQGPVQYLNNILEQDHRAIKRRVQAKQGFREFQAAGRTIQGYEAMNMIRKGQIRWVSGNNVVRQIRFIRKLFNLAT